MGGPKLYDRNELLDRAIELFREQGYTATTTAELSAQLGVNPKSLYAEFGSKQGLFEAALDRYSSHHLAPAFARLEGPDAGLDHVRSSLLAYADGANGMARGLGCLMCNTAVERAALDTASAAYVDAYFKRFTEGFRRALRNAQRDGSIRASADIDALASFLTMAQVGIATMGRANADADQIDAACRVAIAALDNEQATD